MSIRAGKELFLVIVISILLFVAFKYTAIFNVNRISRGHIKLVFRQRSGIPNGPAGAYSEAKVKLTQLLQILDYWALISINFIVSKTRMQFWFLQVLPEIVLEPRANAKQFPLYSEGEVL